MAGTIQTKYYINGKEVTDILTLHYRIRDGRATAIIKVSYEHKKELDNLINDIDEDKITVRYLENGSKVFGTPHFQGHISFMAEEPRKSKRCKLHFLYEFNGVYVK